MKNAVAGTLIVVALLIGFGLGNILSLSSFNVVASPRIEITELKIRTSSQTQGFQITTDACKDNAGNLLGDKRAKNVNAGFTLVNSGDADGFVTVQMVARGETVASTQYFVRAHTQEPKTMTVDSQMFYR